MKKSSSLVTVKAFKLNWEQNDQVRQFSCLIATHGKGEQLTGLSAVKTWGSSGLVL